MHLNKGQSSYILSMRIVIPRARTFCLLNNHVGYSPRKSTLINTHTNVLTANIHRYTPPLQLRTVLLCCKVAPSLIGKHIDFDVDVDAVVYVNVNVNNQRST